MNMSPITLVEYPPIISVNKLIKERGWTEMLVRKHLGPPDALAVNPVRADVPMRVYLMRRVDRAERRREVIADLQRMADGRRLREMIHDGSIEALRETLATELEAVPIDVNVIPIDELRSRAYAARNRDLLERGDAPLDFPPDELSVRSMARYVRRNLVDQASLAEAFEHRAEPWQVEYLLRERIAEAVLAAYPALFPIDDSE